MGLLEQLLGIGSDSFEWYQTAIRAVIIYGAALVMIRIGEKRFLGKNTAFDVLLGVILGSVVSRSINSTSTLLPTIVAGFVLVGLHWLIAILAFRSDRLGDAVKGNARQLVEKGEILWDAMKASHISRQDLMEQVRIKANTEDLGRIKKVYLERSGQFSVILSESKPEILEVEMAEGIQTIRIILEP